MKTKPFLALPLILVLVLGVFYLPSNATGAAILSTAQTQTNASSTTCAMTFTGASNSPTNGNYFIVNSAATSGSSISSISDTAGDTFVKVVSKAAFNNLTMFITQYGGTTGTTNVITITYSGSVTNRCNAIQVIGIKSTTANETSTGSGSGSSSTLSNTVSSFTPTTNNFVIASYFDESLAGGVSAVSEAWNLPFYVQGFGGIQGAVGTSFHFHSAYYPSWISGSTVARVNVTMTGSTSNHFDMVAASFFTGSSSTITDTVTGTTTTTTTTAFSTTLTDTATVTSTSYSPTVTSTSFSPTVTLTNTATVTSTSYSPTVTSTSFSPTVTLTTTETSFSPTVTSTSFSPTVTSTTVTRTTTTSTFNTTTTISVANETSTVSVTQTQVTIPEPPNSTDILLIFLAIAVALIMFALGIKYRKVFVTLIGATVLMLLEIGLLTNPLIVYGANQFPMPIWVLEMIALFVVIGFILVISQLLRGRR